MPREITDKEAIRSGVPLDPGSSGVAVGMGQTIGVDFLGAGNCLGLEGVGANGTWKYSASAMARTEVLEIPLAPLAADPGWTIKQIGVGRLPGDTDDTWRSKQFHALHVRRVRSGGLQGTREGELSCSSCHKTFNPIDRETPRTTCGNCHNGRLELVTKRVVIAKDKPDCTSC